MRRFLDGLYVAAAWLAGFFMVGSLVMVLMSVLGRMLNFNLRGSDSYAGFCIAAALFLALAHTLKRGEHIRVNLLLQHVGPSVRRVIDCIAHGVGVLLIGALTWFSWRLVWQSYTFHDISQGMDATPLWIPQLTMAIGATVLFIAVADDFVTLLTTGELEQESDELLRVE